MTAELPSRSEVYQDAYNDFLFYIQLCDPRYRPGKMHEFIAHKLGLVARGESLRLILNTPPQHGKSRMTAIEFATWLLGRNPRINIAVASYGQKLSNRASREARKRIQSPVYQWLFPETRLAYGAVEHWGTTAGGSFRAVGVGGGITGLPADVIIIDDPLKGHEEATSFAYREKIWEWFVSEVMTRLSPTGVIIVIMTRWHVDDLCGRLLDPKRIEEMKALGFDRDIYKHIKLPAIAKENDLLGRKPGEALWPEKYSSDWIRAQMALMGTYQSAALYDGDPVIKGGNYISIEQFQTIKPQHVPPNLCWMRFWDLAATEAEEIKKNDPDETAGVSGAIRRLEQLGPDGKPIEELYLRDMVYWKDKWPVSREKIRVIAQAEKILIGVEAVSGFKTAADNLREVLPEDVMMRQVGVDGDKLTRALPWIALAENKRVFLVEGEWNTPFMLQAESFPDGDHDDRVDCVSGVYRMLKSGRVILLA